MHVLAIDIGTHTGWAISSGSEIRSGDWNLDHVNTPVDATKELRFWRRLESMWNRYIRIELIAFEDVVAHERSDTKKVWCPKCKSSHHVKLRATNTIAAQVYGSLRGVLRMWADFHRIRIEGVPVGTLKLFATGSGRAKKHDMIAWAKMRWPDQNIQSHDQADALHILDWACVEVLGIKGKARIKGR